MVQTYPLPYTLAWYKQYPNNRWHCDVDGSPQPVCPDIPLQEDQLPFLTRDHAVRGYRIVRRFPQIATFHIPIGRTIHSASDRQRVIEMLRENARHPPDDVDPADHPDYAEINAVIGVKWNRKSSGMVAVGTPVILEPLD